MSGSIFKTPPTANLTPEQFLSKFYGKKDAQVTENESGKSCR